MSEVKIGSKIRLTEADAEITDYWGVAVGTEGEVLFLGGGDGFLVGFDGQEEAFYVFPGEFEVIS